MKQALEVESHTHPLQIGEHEHLFQHDCLIFKIKIIMKKYICTVCQWVYDPEIGDPEQGIEPGVAFENLPDDYVCPLCGVGKEEFEVEE